MTRDRVAIANIIVEFIKVDLTAMYSYGYQTFFSQRGLAYS